MRKGASAILIALIALSTIIYAIPSQAATIPLSEVQQAIDDGISAVYDAVRTIDYGGYYKVMPDHPSPTISIEYNGRAYVPGSFFDPGDRDYKTELVSVTNTTVAWRYYFNVDNDYDYDIIIYAELRNIDRNTDTLFIYVDEAEYTFNILVGTVLPTKLISVNQGWSTTLTIDETNDYKFHSARYVNRHSTIIASWLLEDEGYSYTASKLKQFWQLTGFQYDVYAPVFGRSINYPDDFFSYTNETWLGDGYNAHPWNVDPSGAFLNYPYKSRMYILDSSSAAAVGISGWLEFPLAKLLHAMHLLDKYGLSKASEAELLIEEAIIEGGWDGYGLKQARPYGVPWSYKGYPVYLNAAMLAALVKYYQVTEDRWVAGNDILYMADRLAGILVRLQWDYEHDTPWGPVRLALFRGWWPAAYDIGSLVSKPSAWGLVDSVTSGWDAITGFLDKYANIDVGEAVRPMPSEWPFAIVNSESTILAIQALKLYLGLAQQLGRQPLDVTQLSVLWDGELAGTGGGSTGCPSFSSYCALYSTSSDGWGLSVYAYSDLSWDAWAYAFSKIKLNPTPGDYNLRVAMMVSYEGQDTYGNTGYVYAIVKVYDSNGNIIKSVSDTVAIIENDSLFRQQGVKAITIEIPITVSGTTYVDLGLKAVADTSYLQIAGCLVAASAVIESVILEPS